jgi:predicted nucleic acid-binding protein
MPATTNYFLDSCVFCAYLYDETDKYDVESIEQYLEDAQNGLCRIYTSSVALAEVTAGRIVKPKVSSMRDLIADMRGATVMIDASVNILELAGQLRDIRYKKGTSPGRHLSIGDAVMLASCIHLEDVFNVSISAFHTFDDAKKREVPILSYQEWCEGVRGTKKRLADRVVKLHRTAPQHPTPRLPYP